MFRLLPVGVGAGIRVVAGHRNGGSVVGQCWLMVVPIWTRRRGFVQLWLSVDRFQSLQMVYILKNEEIQ